MRLRILPDEFAVCKLPDFTGVKLDADFCFVANTDNERSLVCRAEDVPANAAVVEPGWRGFRVEGQLDFALVGILARLATVLAQAEISIFAVSTYDTDYILVRSVQLAAAEAALARDG